MDLEELLLFFQKTLLMVQQHNGRQNLIIPSNELQSSNNSALEYDAPPLPPRSAVIFTSMSSTPKVQGMYATKIRNHMQNKTVGTTSYKYTAKSCN